MATFKCPIQDCPVQLDRRSKVPQHLIKRHNVNLDPSTLDLMYPPRRRGRQPQPLRQAQTSPQPRTQSEVHRVRQASQTSSTRRARVSRTQTPGRRTTPRRQQPKGPQDGPGRPRGRTGARESSQSRPCAPSADDYCVEIIDLRTPSPSPLPCPEPLSRPLHPLLRQLHPSGRMSFAMALSPDTATERSASRSASVSAFACDPAATAGPSNMSRYDGNDRREENSGTCESQSRMENQVAPHTPPVTPSTSTTSTPSKRGPTWVVATPPPLSPPPQTLPLTPESLARHRTHGSGEIATDAFAHEAEDDADDEMSDDDAPGPPSPSSSPHSESEVSAATASEPARHFEKVNTLSLISEVSPAAEYSRSSDEDEILHTPPWTPTPSSPPIFIRSTSVESTWSFWEQDYIHPEVPDDDDDDDDDDDYTMSQLERPFGFRIPSR